MRPTYFDFTVNNLKDARKFFENVFGWSFEKFPMPYEYYRISAGSDKEIGIDGGIGEVKDTPITGGKPLTQVTIPVQSLDEFIEKVKANGGNIIEPKMAIPTIGWYATCAEPGGLMFGIVQADPNAK
ncbi:VOC family protein [Candidatus Omnitrophota bacterium]